MNIPEGYHKNPLQREPGAEDIQLCLSCPLSSDGGEAFLYPSRYFTMGLDQTSRRPEDRVGYISVKFGLHARGTMEIDYYDGTGPQTLEGIVPRRCEPLRDLEVSEEDWQNVREASCPGPEHRGRKYVVCGPRKISCGLLQLLQNASHEAE